MRRYWPKEEGSWQTLFACRIRGAFAGAARFTTGATSTPFFYCTGSTLPALSCLVSFNHGDAVFRRRIGQVHPPLCHNAVDFPGFRAQLQEVHSGTKARLFQHTPHSTWVHAFKASLHEPDFANVCDESALYGHFPGLLIQDGVGGIEQ